MARVRSRLMGFDDNGPRAAAEVLQALTRGMGSTEERATFLPDAFTPPGLQVSCPHLNPILITKRAPNPY